MPAGTAGQVLRTGGASANPSWVSAREVLTANRTYYVRTDVSDANNGLANTSGGAFLTIQKAWDAILTIDLGGFTVTIQIADGTFTAGIVSSRSPIDGTVVVLGNATTPANVGCFQ